MSTPVLNTVGHHEPLCGSGMPSEGVEHFKGDGVEHVTSFTVTRDRPDATCGRSTDRKKERGRDGADPR